MRQPRSGGVFRLWLGAAPTALGIPFAMFPSPYGLG